MEVCSSRYGATSLNSKVEWCSPWLGLSLLTQAYRESNVPLHNTDEISADLTRQLYVHSMTYLLQGLPVDLTPEENFTLRAAAPQNLVNTNSDPEALVSVEVPSNKPVSAKEQLQKPTILHRVTAMAVFYIFVLVQFLLPYVRLFVSHAYQFEREHQITKRMVASGVNTVDELSRRTVRLSQMLYQMNDGRTAQTINELTLWWIRGLAGGVQQGIEEGLSVVDARCEAVK